MAHQIFINLPIKDLPRSIAFWRALGFEFNPRFTDDRAACLIFSSHGYAMLLTEPFFKEFVNRGLCDTTKQLQALFAISCDSRAGVDTMMQKALAHGGSEPIPPKDHGFMYQRGFDDPDHHHWEIFYMDPAHAGGESA